MACCSTDKTTHSYRFTKHSPFTVLPSAHFPLSLNFFLSFLPPVFRWDRFSSGCGYFTARGEYATPTPTYTSTPSSSKSQSLRYFSLLPVSFCFSSRLLPIVVVHLQYPWSIKPIKKQTFVSFWFQRASLQLGYSSDGIEAQAVSLNISVLLSSFGYRWTFLETQTQTNFYNLL